jgi:cellulose biosynthesis protein BcsQ
VTFAQQMKSAGKTTVSVHLAVAWARKKGISVALLDVDP